jgi:hypothetical protein
LADRQAPGRPRTAPATAPATASPQSPQPAVAQSPARAAALARIQELLGAHHRDAALDAYTAFVAQEKRDDYELLGLIARDHLEGLAGSSEVDVKVAALKTLAAVGDAKAKAALVQYAAAGARDVLGLESAFALASLKSDAVAGEIRSLATSAPKTARPRAIAALGDLDRTTARSLARQGLSDADPFARMAYTDVVAQLGATDAIPQLKAMLDDPNAPFLRLPAAAALRRLGDPAGDVVLRQRLDNGLPDARLIAARALAETGDRLWPTAIVPILQDPDGLNRLVAAELLLPVERPAALRSLRAAAADGNPVIRAEAARVVALAAPPDLPALEAFLADKSELARGRAAGRLLELATSAGTQPKRSGR